MDPNSDPFIDPFLVNLGNKIRQKNNQNRSVFRKHRILRVIIKPLVLVTFPWSLNLNMHICSEHNMILHENRGAPDWEKMMRKSHGAHHLKCAVHGVCNGKVW